MNKGGNRIEFDIKNELNGELANATDLKAFFWDLRSIKPLSDLISLPLDNAIEDNKITLTINSKTFTASLEDNETVAAFKDLLPMTIDMNELNGNEKYYYMPQNLPSKSEKVSTIYEGDIMLYGSNCLVVFYETFDTPYTYTKIGHIDDVSGLKEAVGSENVTVTIE